MTHSVTWLCRPDVCRCCLAGSGAWDLTGAYTSEGKGNEVLLDMLRDCLGIALSNVSEWGPSRFICDGCATSLRQAHNFKQQVIRAEDAFAKHLGGKGDNLDLSLVKTEKTVEENDTNCLEKHSKVHDDDDIEPPEMKPEVEEETIKIDYSIAYVHPDDTEGDIKNKRKKVRHNCGKKCMTKSKSTKTKKIDRSVDKRIIKDIGPGTKHIMKDIGTGNKHMKLIGSKDKDNNTDKSSCINDGNEKYLLRISNDYDSDTPISQMLTKSLNCLENNDFPLVKKVKSSENEFSQTINIACKAPQRPKHPVKQVSERKRIRLTCEIVLKDTTACPFRHHKSWFQCFYCTLDFMEINMLRQHTLQNHRSEDVASIKRYPRSLQIDITEFKCKICCLNLSDVKNMVMHFSEIHGKIVYKECIADYKVNASPYTCHICSKQYHVFRTLTTHLNEHYANCICDVCGKSFLNSKRLKVHKRTHESGNFPCKECGKILKTKTSKANHMESHSKRIIKCHICLKPMKHYNDRIKHMSEEHNITHLFKCVICGREYKIKHYLATHMRQTHGHKNKKCPECGMAFITNHGLKKHMLKHSGVKAFACKICKKSYARSYTLKEHMRGHEGETKFVGT